MLKLRFSKPSVKTYMDGKVTVCKYDCTLIEKSTNRVVDTFAVTGTSKCSPNDSIDVDYGRKLADSRAKLAAYRIASNVVDHECIPCMIEDIKKNAELIDFVTSMQYLKKKEVEHIKFLNSEASE